MLKAPAEWLEARKGYIGGTDIAAVLGLHPYKSAIDVWAEKLGQKPPFEGNLRTRLGNALEEFVASEYASAAGVEVLEGPGWVCDPELKFFGGNPDRLVGTDTVLEIKSYGFAQSKRWGPEGSDIVPEEYALQVQWYLMLTGRTRGVIAALAKADDVVRVYEIERSETIIKTMREAGAKFWREHVVTGTMPEPDGSFAAEEAIKALLPRERPGLVIDATEELERYAIELSEIAQKFRALGRRKGEIEQRIKTAMGEAEAMNLQAWPKPITWRRSKDVVGPDYKEAFIALCARLQVDPAVVADLLDAHQTVTRQGSRIFNVPWAREKE